MQFGARTLFLSTPNDYCRFDGSSLVFGLAFELTIKFLLVQSHFVFFSSCTVVAFTLAFFAISVSICANLCLITNYRWLYITAHRLSLRATEPVPRSSSCQTHSLDIILCACMCHFLYLPHSRTASVGLLGQSNSAIGQRAQQLSRATIVSIRRH